MKRIPIFLFIILSLAFSACGNSDKAIEQNESITSVESISNDEQTNLTETTTLSGENDLPVEEIVEDPVTPNGYPIIPIEEFMGYISTVELTTENWRDYIELNTIIIEDKDAFGDVISSTRMRQWETKKGLAIQNSKNLAFKIKHKTEKYEGTMEAWGTYWFLEQGEWFNGLDDEIIADDYNCIKAQGSIYVINVPEDKWIAYDNNPDFQDSKSNEKVIEKLASLCPDANKVIYVGTKNDYCMVTNLGYIWSNEYDFLCLEPAGFNHAYYIGDAYNWEETE